MEHKVRRVTEIGNKLYHRVHAHHRVSSYYYCVTITPKGNDMTHTELSAYFLEELMKYKQIKNYFLVYESENTNHMHGIIRTSQEYSFKRLYNKKYNFNFHIKDCPLRRWCNYMSKSYPDFFYTNYGVECII